MVAAGDTAALAYAIADLIGDPTMRLRLGDAGRARVQARFAMDSGVDSLAMKFGLEARHAAE
jgi:hypothetical protein